MPEETAPPGRQQAIAPAGTRVAPGWVLAVLMLAAAAWLVWESRGQSFYGDEWDLFAGYGGWEPEVLLHPDGGVLVLGPVIAYKALIAVFEGGTYVPERLLWVALDLAAAGLFYALARRRVGDWGALFPTALLLVFGAAGEFGAGPPGIPVFAAVGFGLAALILLERGDPAADAGACLALLAAVCCDISGVAFAAAAAIGARVGSEGESKEPKRILWPALVPLALFALWWVWALKFDQTGIELEDLVAAPVTIAESLAAVTAAIAGTFRSRDLLETGEFHSAAGWVIAVAALGALTLALSRKPDLRAELRRADRRFWTVVLLPLTFWALLAIGVGPSENPETDRYLYPGAAMLLLAGSELVARIGPPRGVLAALAAVLVLGMLANASALRDSATLLRYEGENNRVELSALELVAANAERSLQIEPLGVPGALREDIEVTIGAYLSSAAARGSPAFDAASLPERRDDARARSDILMVKALKLTPLPAQLPGRGGAPPRPAHTTEMKIGRAGSCTLLRPQQPGASAEFELPAQGLILRQKTGIPSLHLALRRFGDRFIPLLPQPESGSPVGVAPPPDESPAPWHLLLVASSPVEVCAA